MIEESFVRLYAQDFVQMAVRSGLGQDVDAALQRRLTEARIHAVVMDDRKSKGHLAALVRRVRDEAGRVDGRAMRYGDDPALAAQRRLRFLSGVAEALNAPPPSRSPDRLSARRAADDAKPRSKAKADTPHGD
ncbi:hypothetical protein RSD66_01095 [Brevundimonas sp. S1H14]|uniref:hypothetical protein n=1 Tax=Brevundimonas sp. S1H14 TaxID=3078084 RepID=UPI0039EBB05F